MGTVAKITAVIGAIILLGASACFYFVGSAFGGLDVTGIVVIVGLAAGGIAFLYFAFKPKGE